MPCMLKSKARHLGKRDGPKGEMKAIGPYEWVRFDSFDPKDFRHSRDYLVKAVPAELPPKPKAKPSSSSSKKPTSSKSSSTKPRTKKGED